MPIKKKAKPAPVKVRTPQEVASAAIIRFISMTSNGASVDSESWKKAISEEARVFAAELIQEAARVAGGKVGQDIVDKLAVAAG